MSDVPFVQDILGQPEALERAAKAFDAASLRKLAAELKAGKYDRILIAGMGASLYAAYPAWQMLSKAGVPALWVDAAELIHHARGLVSSKTLLWLVSQSGRSAEINGVLDGSKVHRPAALMATVNDLQSPLALAANYCIPVRTDPEATVSTRTYVNSLALGELAARALLGADLEDGRRDLLQTVAVMKRFLADWEGLKQWLAELVGIPKRLVLLGRGVSYGSACEGALILAEAAKFLATPFQAGEFRHGPLEMAGPDLMALIFEGPSETRDLNLRMLRELRDTGTRAFGIGTSGEEWQIAIPEVPPIGLPLIEILPIQALCVHLAEAIGIRPGEFFRIGKITLRE